ncbi:MAG: hypothetical protein QXV54_05685 [Desulfurococcaceae archaeon]
MIAEALVNESIEIASSEKICGELTIKRVFEKQYHAGSVGSGLIIMREIDLGEIALIMVNNMVSWDSRRAIMELVIK